VLAPLLWFLLAAWMMAVEYLEYPLGNHGMSFPQVRRLVAANRKLAMGYGAGIIALTMVPGINFIVMPVAVCGATRMYLDRLQQHEITPGRFPGNTG
jgi:CysZ protein